VLIESSRLEALKRAVDASKARKADSYLWDGELPGFGPKVTPAGRKGYLVQYRLGGRKGRTRCVTIGRHGEITPTFAPELSQTLARGDCRWPRPGIRARRGECGRVARRRARTIHGRARQAKARLPITGPAPFSLLNLEAGEIAGTAWFSSFFIQVKT
jgi:hypothetical protein